MSRRVPVPPVVLRYYGGVDRFIAATPGLFWNGPSDHISLHPDLHRRLHTTGQQPPYPPPPSPGARSATKGSGHQYQQHLGAVARVQQRYLPGVGGNTIKSPGHQQQQQLGAIAGVQQRYLPAHGVGPGGQLQQKKQSKKQLKKQRKKQQQQQQQPLSPAAAAAERKAQAERIKAEATAWMQRVALYLTPAVPPEKPPCISQQNIRKHVPIPRCLLDHYGSARAVMQSLTHLGLYWNGPLDNTPHVRIHHAQHVELRAAALAAGQLPPAPAAAAAAGAGGWVAPAGMPAQVAAQAHGWLHWLAQRVPLTDPPQWVPRKLLYQEMPIPQPVVSHFKGSGSFLTSFPGLKQHTGSLALQADLHRALLAEAATADEGADARQQGDQQQGGQQRTSSSMDLAP